MGNKEVRISVRLKWIGLLLFIILGFAFAVYFLVRIPIEKSFRQTYAKALSERLEELKSNEDKERNNLAQSVSDLLQNPRLIAALESANYEQFYYDLAKLAEPIFRRKDLITDRTMPFVRFIDWQGEYHPPPPSLSEDFGIKVNIDEALLRIALNPMSQSEETVLNLLSGFVELEIGNGFALFEAKNIPLIDFYGEYWGDLIFIFPSEDSFRYIPNQQMEIQGTLTPRHFYSPQISESIETIIFNNVTASAFGKKSFNLKLNQSNYIAYISPNEVSNGFLETARIVLFSMENQELLLIAIQKTILIASVAFVLIALLVSLVATYRLTIPITWLMEGTEQIRAGNFKHRIPVRTRDELGTLSQQFNSMTSELELKERYRAVLDMVTDPQVAKELTAGEQISLGGEDRNATVLFCDIRAFTPWSETLEPKELVKQLNEHMNAMTQIVHKYNGVVDKFVGDELMALFGVPYTYGEDTQSAIACAKEMLETCQKRFLKGSEIQVGIGLASGHVVAGCMGSKDRLNYTVIGKNVNLASRLCSSAKAGTCLMDTTTYDAVRNDIHLTPSSLKLKGFAQEVDAYEYSV